MKVCYVTHLPNLTGANRSLVDMLDGVDKTVVQPIVLLNGHGPIEEELKLRNIKYRIVFYVPATNSDDFLKNIGKHICNTRFLNRFAVNCIKKVFKEEKIDLVHNNTFLVGAGMQAALELKIPYICHIREFVWEDHHRKFFYEKRQIELLKRADAIIAITEAVKNKFQLLTEKRIEVLYDGIKIKNYLLPLEKKLHGEEVDILMAGRITPGKGQFEAIKAMEILKRKGIYNCKLTIIGGIGDKKYNAMLHRYVEQHMLSSVKFVQFTKDLKLIRGKYDIGLTCSKAEALGRVTIENMLSSLLIIAGNTAGTRELVKDGVTGYLYNPDSSEELADVIVHSIKNVEKSNQIIKNAYEEACEKFDYLSYSRAVLKMYEIILFKDI